MDGEPRVPEPLGADPKWMGDGAGRHYAQGRWRNARAAQRDPVFVDRILSRYGVRPTLRPVLDAPCGTGRLRPTLERRGLRYVGLDLSPSMLGEAHGGTDASLVQGSVTRLPFRDEAFEVVVCCRLLHHLDEGELESVLSELARVAHRLVVASFWDAASLHALRRRVGLRKDEGTSGRRAIEKRRLREAFARSGADVVGFHHSFRFVSQQAFVVALKRAPVGAPARRTAGARLSTFHLDPRGGALGQAPV